MIPFKTDAETRERYVANVIATWSRATFDQQVRGRNWYRTAHQLAAMLADGNVEMGAGVIAALSANKSWSENTRLATRAFAEGKPTGHVQDALMKATRIMEGESPENVLPMDIKTGQFYRCIVNPDDKEAVCVDRHAHDVAVGKRYGNKDRGLSSRARYNLIADAYREAARRLGELPMDVQAVTWIVQIESNT